jgi:hypothetical protein
MPESLYAQSRVSLRRGGDCRHHLRTCRSTTGRGSCCTSQRADAPAQRPPTGVAARFGRIVGPVRPPSWKDPLVGWWSWRESNPRPSSGSRPRYDHSRIVALRLPPCRIKWALRPRRLVFPWSQWSFTPSAVSPCCPPPLLLPGCDGQAPRAIAGRYLPRLPDGSGSESEVVVGLCLVAPFKESEQLRSHVRVPSFTSKPISPVSVPPSRCCWAVGVK